MNRSPVTADFFTGGRRSRVCSRSNPRSQRRQNRRKCCSFKPALTDQWDVANLSADTRQAIKAAILRADATFWNCPDAPGANTEAMRFAFSGIAKALFKSGVLTEYVLITEIPLLVWDSAIAGGWWYLAAETRTEIFPYQMGHYWVWLEESRDWEGSFRSEIQQWRAQLLEAPSSPRARASHESNNAETSEASPEVVAGETSNEEGDAAVPDGLLHLKAPFFSYECADSEQLEIESARLNANRPESPPDTRQRPESRTTQPKGKSGRPKKDQTSSIQVEWNKLGRPKATATVCDKIG